MAQKNGHKKETAEQVVEQVMQPSPQIALDPKPLHRRVLFRVLTGYGKTVIEMTKPCGHTQAVTMPDEGDLAFPFDFTIRPTEYGWELDEDCHRCKVIDDIERAAREQQ